MGSFSVNRPVSVLMLTLLMLLFGAAAYTRLPSDLFPDISQPGLVVHTAYEGAASSEIESTVTAKLEEKLGSVKGVVGMKSISGEERSDIALTFAWGTRMDLAAMDVRAKLDEVADDLPEDAEEPVVLRTAAGSGAVMVLDIAPNSRAARPTPAAHLRKLIERLVKPRLERINGVAAVEVRGGTEYEVRVKVRPDALSAHRLSILDVRDALERENLSQRGGKLREEGTQYLIRTVGTFGIHDLKDLIVSQPGKPVVRLREVATFAESEVPKPAESLARLKTTEANTARPSVQIRILKKSGGNSVAICEAVRAACVALLYEQAQRMAQAPALPEGAVEDLGRLPTGASIPEALVPLREFLQTHAPFAVAVSYDESVFITESLAMVQSNGLQGLILASLILLVFLRRIQSTVIVVLSMPVSVIATFSLFYAGGLSVNIFSMAGLTLAVGMVVDNAIVVTEAIFHKLSYEKRVKKAVTEAVQEIGPAVWASTLTTIAVFLPIVFVPGVAGQIFRDLSWVITYTLIFSIVVAFTLIPMLTFQVMGFEFALFTWINAALDMILAPVSALAERGIEVYKRALRVFLESLGARVVLVGVMLALLVGCLFIIPPSEFFPETKVESYALTLRPRVGQTLAAVDMAAREVEQFAAAESEIRRFSMAVTPRQIRLIATFDKDAVMSEALHPVNVLARITQKIDGSAQLADRILDYKIESLNPMQNLLGTGEGDILVQVTGPDLTALQQILTGPEGLLRHMQEQRVAYGIATIGKPEGGVPEWIIRIKRNAAADAGLTLAEIAAQVEAAVAGVTATDLTLRDTTYDIVLSSGAKLANKEDLLNLDIQPPAGAGRMRAVKLREVATLEEARGQLAIYRNERELALYASLFVDKSRSTLGETAARLRAPGGRLDQLQRQYGKDGYRIRLRGASEAMDESMGYMLYAFLVAVILVYMVMASQFESLVHPFTIMFSVPLSLIGAVIGLRISGDSLSLTAMIGIIMLAGIVVNNAIILIDYINILRARGHVRNDAIVEAGVTRMRPIFMTTLTTVLGMAPLALGFGTGAELYKPLAVVVVAGLSLSTLLTLIFIPAVYCFADDISDAVGFVSFRLSLMFGKHG